jgi:hypothetical protein
MGPAEEIEHAMDEPAVPLARCEHKVRPVSAELVEELTTAVQVLTDQVRCLRLAIDEIEAELGWAIRTRVIPQLRSPSLVTSTEPGADQAGVTFAHPIRASGGGGEKVPSMQASLW